MLAAFKFLGAGCATIALIGAGVGIGTIFGALILAVGRVPERQTQLLQLAMLGFALCEATGLFGLIIAFIILFG